MPDVDGAEEPTASVEPWREPGPEADGSGLGDRVVELVDAIVTVASGLRLDQVLRRIVEAACSLVDARYGALGVLSGDGGLSEFIVVGVNPATERAIGHRPTGQGILGLLIADPRPIRLRDLGAHHQAVGFPPGHPPMGSFLGVPILAHGEVFGNLYLTEKIVGDFSDTDERLVVALAATAGVAIDNAQLHRRLAELALLEDRERIARDLHDSVIQRLFATGMSLQSTVGLTEDSVVRNRIDDAVEAVDDTIGEIRSTIFALHPHSRPIGRSVRDLVETLKRTLGLDPAVAITGDPEITVDPERADHVLSIVREALTNVARHAEATRVTVTLDLAEDLALTVADNGRGVPDGTPLRGHGMRNMAERARILGGHFEVRNQEVQGHVIGTELIWRIPLGNAPS